MLNSNTGTKIKVKNLRDLSFCAPLSASASASKLVPKPIFFSRSLPQINSLFNSLSPPWKKRKTLKFVPKRLPRIAPDRPKRTLSPSWDPPGFKIWIFQLLTKSRSRSRLEKWCQIVDGHVATQIPESSDNATPGGRRTTLPLAGSKKIEKPLQLIPLLCLQAGAKGVISPSNDWHHYFTRFPGGITFDVAGSWRDTWRFCMRRSWVVAILWCHVFIKNLHLLFIKNFFSNNFFIWSRISVVGLV